MDLICFSHLRWNFVFQRPQHLLSRFASTYRVVFIEEPIFDTDTPALDVTLSKEQVWVVTPHLQAGISNEESFEQQQRLLSGWAPNFGVDDFIAWFYTPLALPLLDAFPEPTTVVYDCMDELSAFKGADQNLKQKEQQLLKNADVVFTGGQSLYEAKKHLHDNIHAFPSSIDKHHFMKARLAKNEPEDQKHIPHPRIGFFGVIDERLDIDLIRDLAARKPEWEFILVGPVVKIDPETLPKACNIHFLGGRAYDQLPEYLAGWDVALIPFALNESTQFISPTKTPEYLAGAIPVVSSRITDVVEPYGNMGLVYIADTTDDFISGIEWAMQRRYDFEWLKEVDLYLAGLSWDITWENMSSLINEAIATKQKGNVITNSPQHV